MEKPANDKKPVNKSIKTKGVSLEFDLPTYWKIQDVQRKIEEETGIKKPIAFICEQLVLEALAQRQAPAKKEPDKA